MNIVMNNAAASTPAHPQRAILPGMHLVAVVADERQWRRYAAGRVARAAGAHGGRVEDGQQEQAVRRLQQALRNARLQLHIQQPEQACDAQQENAPQSPQRGCFFGGARQHRAKLNVHSTTGQTMEYNASCSDATTECPHHLHDTALYDCSIGCRKALGEALSRCIISRSNAHGRRHGRRR